jgi:SAM-dependent methyltransferase
MNQLATHDLLNALRRIGEHRGDRSGNRDAALLQIATQFPLLATALRQPAAQDGHGHVYAQPAAFTAFIEGGGNVALYEAVSAALAGSYRRHDIESLLDIGCGNGLALTRALQLASAPRLRQVDLVEPAMALLGTAHADVKSLLPELAVDAWPLALQEFLAAPLERPRWQLAQSTFCLQAITPELRWPLLGRLRERIDRLCIVEFDVVDFGGDRDAWRLSLAQRYERAIGEYDTTRELVACGFLIPMLMGQLSGNTANTNWEHPAAHWQSRLQDIGYRNVSITRLHDYFWSPAFLLQAEA